METPASFAALEADGDYNTVMAVMLVSLPILVIIFCIQEYMVSVLTAGGVKG